jgi:hypothetical protein
LRWETQRSSAQYPDPRKGEEEAVAEEVLEIKHRYKWTSISLASAAWTERDEQEVTSMLYAILSSMYS